MLAVSSTNMWKVVMHKYSCLLKEKHSIYIKFTSFKLWFLPVFITVIYILLYIMMKIKMAPLNLYRKNAIFKLPLFWECNSNFLDFFCICKFYLYILSYTLKIMEVWKWHFFYINLMVPFLFSSLYRVIYI
jgi:hypothetical protein